MEKRGTRLSLTPAGRFEAAARMVARYADSVVPIDQFISVRPPVGHGEFLAGLVRDRALARWLGYGRACRAPHCSATWRCLRDLRQRSRVKAREAIHQALY